MCEAERETFEVAVLAPEGKHLVDAWTGRIIAAALLGSAEVPALRAELGARRFEDEPFFPWRALADLDRTLEAIHGGWRPGPEQLWPPE